MLPASKLGKTRTFDANHLITEVEGFEPPNACALTVFETVPLNHSGKPPTASNEA